jgi:predicted nucleotidyltransferase
LLFKDREFIESKEGLIFCVVGYVHPRDRVIAYLKYLPSAEGKWSSGSKHYSRAMKYYSASEVVRNVDWLKKHYPHYVFHSKVFGFKISAVPKQYILRHYIPQKRLEEIIKKGPEDALEQKVLDLVDLLSERSGVPKSYFGVTGSILLKIHNPSFSDIDLVVYGREQSLKVKNAVLSLYDEFSSGLTRLKGATLEKWCLEKAEAYPVSVSEAAAIYGRRWNYALYKGTAFSIHPTRLDQEVESRYGSERFRGLGFARIRARVKKVVEALYTPYIYALSDVKVEEGDLSWRVSEVVSYEGFYGGLAQEGEEVIAYGKVEEVKSSSSKDRLRLLIGSPEAGGRDFLKPLNLCTSEQK